MKIELSKKILMRGIGEHFRRYAHALRFAIGRVANSHAYGVILTHWTCYSRTHAIDKFTHAFKRNHTHTHAIL